MQIQQLTFFGDGPKARVQVFLGDGPDATQSDQWISARLTVVMQPLKSVELQRLAILQAMQDAIQVERTRLEAIYNEAAKSLR